jgi:hypothetical protein
MSYSKNIWKEFAIETDGKFIDREEPWLSDRTELEYNGWKIYFDNYDITSGKYSATMTRVIVPFISVDDFRFEIYRDGFIRKIEKIFGSQDFKIGQENFDKAFIIKTNNEAKIRTLLQNQQLRNQIEAQNKVNIVISDQKGIWENRLLKDELELIFYVDGEIKDFEILKSILNLFKEMLDGLEQLNVMKKPATNTLQ